MNPPSSARLRLRAPLILLILATAFGLALRCFRLGSVPPKLWYDEAWFVNRARDLLETGGTPIYFANAGAGVHPLHVYLTAAMALVAGITPITGRLVTALAGSLTAPLTYLASRDLLAPIVREDRKRWLAGLAALLQAGLFWNVMLSRLGTEIIHVQLLAIPVVHTYVLGVRRRRGRWFVACGALVGAALYVSPNARFIPVALALAAAGIALLFPASRGRALRGLALVGLVALLVFAPLGWHFLQHPDDFFGRARTVTAQTFGADGAPLALLRNLANTLVGISIRGDTMIRHNLPGRPNLDPILSLLFWIGLARLLRRIRAGVGGVALLGWAAGLTLTTVLSDGAPIFTRSLGAAPAMIMIAVLGIADVLDWLSQRIGGRAAVGVLTASIAISLGLNVFDYFVRFADHPATFDGFTVGAYRAAETALRLTERDAVYLSPPNALADEPNHELLLRGTSVRGFNTANCQMYFPDRANHYFVDAIDDYHGIGRLAGRFPSGSVTQTIEHEPDAYPLTRIFTVPAGSPPNMSLPADTSFGDGAIALVGADVWNLNSQPGDLLYVTLAWQALQPVTVDLVALVHVASEAAAIPVAGHDSAPCGGTYRTSAWRVGEVVFDGHVLALPADLHPGQYRIYVGLYTWPDQARIPPDAGGTADGRLELVTLDVVNE